MRCFGALCQGWGTWGWLTKSIGKREGAIGVRVPLLCEFLAAEYVGVGNLNATVHYAKSNRAI